MQLRPKNWLARLETCPHGGINYAELKDLVIDPDKILDFSVSTNPFMPPPSIREMLKEIRFDRYPDSQATILKQLLARRLGVDTCNILVGSGTTELIRIIALAYFRRNDHILIPEPVYGEYEVASLIAGAHPLKLRSTGKNCFNVKINGIIDTIKKSNPRAVFICNPNNPTGKYLSRVGIERILNSTGDCLLIIDEAYVAFVEESWDSLELIEKGNIIILRSMTKDYGFPGLRLGYAVARRDIINCLRPILPPWNVNSIAQEAGIAVLKEDDYLQQSLKQVREVKYFLTAELAAIGFKVIPSDTHYFLVKVGNATAFRRSLLKHGIMVRDCTSFGLPEYIRVSPLYPDECKKLIEAMKRILNSAEKGEIF